MLAEYDNIGALTEVSNQICLHSVRRPFPVHNVSVWRDIEAKFLITSAESLQAAFCVVDSLDPFLSMTESTSQGISKRGKPRVKLNNAYTHQI